MPLLQINPTTTIDYELSDQVKPLVLIAGYRGDHTAWDLMQRELESHFQVLLFDNLGIGQTKDNGQPLSIEIMADATMSLDEHLDLNNPHIVGQFMVAPLCSILAENMLLKSTKWHYLIQLLNPVHLLAIH